MLDKTRQKFDAIENAKARQKRHAERLAAVTKAIKQHHVHVEEVDMILPVGFLPFDEDEL